MQLISRNLAKRRNRERQLTHPFTGKTQRVARFCSLLTAIVAAAGFARITGQTDSPDRYQWLEDVSSKRSLSWVNRENQRSAKVIENDPRFPELKSAALKIAQSPDRLPTPELNEGYVFNTWQDAQHVNGVLRRTPLADYLTKQPHWQTLLDYDALGQQDHQKWVQEGRACLYPENELCLMDLSAGGEDASTMREFNLKTAQFVPGGFVLPRSKQEVDWIDRNTLLVARDWGPGTMTKSGYPFVLKIWKRGQPLEQAKEMFRGQPTDVRVFGMVLNDSQGHHVVLAGRGVNFFETEFSLLTAAGPQRIGLPGKVDIGGLLDGRIIVALNQDWQPSANISPIAQGSVIALDLDAVNKDPLHLQPTIVFAPTAKEFAEGQMATTKDHLLLATLENVQGRIYSFAPGPNGVWTRKKLNVPDNRAVSIVSANWSDNHFFLRVAGFLSPSSLLLGDAATGSLQEAKTLPPQFDASADVVEQLYATSKDGTKIPYFVVRRKDIPLNGNNPTLLTAYGGFQVSSTPYYNASLGKLWLEQGGVFALANIRGGGEFGPAWHEAGLKTHRQRIYDDFAAVGQDLVSRRITSPRRLGIEGGSNGGLLMGVEMTQHPEMWHAIIIQVPLLDMLRFEQIAAGASWVGEYGSVANADERAFLASISPYHQLKAAVAYPEPLICTTTKDDRVGPVHARKFAAKMEELHKPFLYREIIEGGHNTGADLKEQAETAAVEYTYLMRKLMD